MNAKTQILIDRIIKASSLPPVPFRIAIEIALKEQDRNTRHACAEAVSALPIQGDIPATQESFKARAHDACINVQTI